MNVALWAKQERSNGKRKNTLHIYVPGAWERTNNPKVVSNLPHTVESKIILPEEGLVQLTECAGVLNK